MYEINSKIHIIVNMHGITVKIYSTIGIIFDYVQDYIFVRGIDTLYAWLIRSMTDFWKKFSAHSI